jgi:predicted ATPase/DNA-binding SARP family transcriptional activator
MDGPRRLAIGGRRQLTLLSFLLLHANEAVSSDAVSDAIWGPARSRSDNRLPMAIVRLRRALEPLNRNGEPPLRTVGSCYMLSVGPGELDAEAFRAGVQAGRRALQAGEAGRAAELLVTALGLWRGPALAEVAFEDFAQAETRRLEELRLVAIETRIDADLELGRHHELVGELEALVSKQPTREGLAAQLMVALYRCGRQADALEVYRRTRTHLIEELGLDPGPALRALQIEILEQVPSLQLGRAPLPLVEVSFAVDPAALPVASTATIGRRGEVEALCDLFTRRGVRLVTLTGPGGVGKTRVALEAAHALQASFADGACWVELAGVARPEDVGSTVTKALGVTPVPGERAEDTLPRAVAGKRLLLVIDNFEHVLDAAGLVGELHGTCPQLGLLITSREALNLTGEHRVVVAPLAVPALTDAVSVDEIESTDASALLLAAARRHDSRFFVTPSGAPAIARICARLDGLPLALELAAARTEVLSVEELDGLLEASGDELGAAPRDAPARHHTMSATIEWSYRLLNTDEEHAFARFAVFAGGATLDAARSVTGATASAIEALIAKSLLERRRQAPGRTRLVMLETIKQYALARLTEDLDERAAREAHLEYYLRIVGHATPFLSTHAERDALVAIDTEIDNILGALAWALEQAPERALRLAGKLGDYWYISGDAEGLPWLDAVIRAAPEGAPPEALARAHLARSQQLFFRMEHPAGAEAARTSLELYERAGEHAGISNANNWLSTFALVRGEVDEMRKHAELSCQHAGRAGDDHLLGRALLSLASALPSQERRRAVERGAELLTQAGNYRDLAIGYSNAAWEALKEDDLTEAVAWLELALHTVEHARAPHTLVLILGNLGFANLLCTDFELARAAFARQLDLCSDHGLPSGAHEGLAGLAALAALNGETRKSARLLGAAHALGWPTGEAQPIANRLEHEFFAPARARCAPDAWRREQQIGATLSFEEAISYALADPGP